MSTHKNIPRASSAGYDRIEWFDAKRRVHSAKAVDARSVARVRPEAPARRPGKWVGQSASQGYYWCAGTQTMLRHESMMEFTSLMLFDHLFDLVNAVAQPMMLTFADGTHHVPDFLLHTVHDEVIVLDVHDKAMTTDTDVRAFELTRQLCERVGWRFELIDTISEVTRWNLEMMARYNHPRYAPDGDTRLRILKAVKNQPAFGALRKVLATSRPGEHLPGLYHLMWNRAIRFELDRRFTDHTRLHLA